MSYTIEIGAGDVPKEYADRNSKPVQRQIAQDLRTLSNQMEGVHRGDRQRALAYAILEALERRETDDVADSAADDGVNRTKSGKRDLSTIGGDDDGQTVTDDADDVERTPAGKRDLSKHTD